MNTYHKDNKSVYYIHKYLFTKMIERIIRRNEFSAKDLDNKMTEWICAVIDAALKDQGGVLKRK